MLKGKMYDYLGHFRQERFLTAGHNTMAEPAATQEALGFSKARRRRAEDENNPAVRRSLDNYNDLKRVAGDEAKQFRKEYPDAGIKEFDFSVRYKREHPGATNEDARKAYKED